MARITSASNRSAHFRAVVHPCGTWEVIDRVVCGGVALLSHLVIGKRDAADAIAAGICDTHEGAYLVTEHGQGGHTEWVVHRPLPDVK